MKVNRLFAAAVAALTVLGATSLPAWAQVAPIRQAQAPAAAPAAARPTGPGTSVAVIDLQEVFDRHLRFKAGMDNINKDTEQLNAQFRADQKELQKMMEKLKDLKPGTPDYKRQEEATAQYESNLRVQQQLQRKDVGERQAKHLYQTYEEVTAAVQSFAERNGIGLVIQFSADEIEPSNPQSIMRGLNRPVVYQRNLNITEYIIEIVNAGTKPPAPAPVQGGVAPVSNRPTVPGRF